VSKWWLVVSRLHHTDAHTDAYTDAYTQRRHLQWLLGRSAQVAQLVVALVVVDGRVRVVRMRLVRMLVRMRLVRMLVVRWWRRQARRQLVELRRRR